jgi:hypothetical protein
MYMPINLTGGSYQHRSRPLACQRTVNFWPQIQEGAGTSDSILDSFPGLRMFSLGDGTERGMYAHRGILYKVTGTSLHSISSTGTRTLLGTITGTGRCVIEGLKNSVIIVSEGDVWEWDQDAETLTAGSDVDFENPFSVAVLNNQAIYDGLEDRFCTSEVGVPLNIDGLDYATAESNADKLTRVYAFDSYLWLLGQKTVEKWYNSGDGRPPFDRVEGGIYEVGCGARYSAAQTDQAMYFLGDDRNVYSISNAGLNGNIVPSALVREFSNYGAYSDAIGWTMKFQKQSFYVLKFPSANKTWAYPEGGVWFQLNSSRYDLGGDLGRYRINSYAYCFNKHLVADEDGNVLELTEDAFTEHGDRITRVRDSAPIHGGLLGKPGKNIELSELTLVMEVGTGDVTTPNPQVMLSISIDGGRTFGTEMWQDIGDTGEYLREIRWSGLNAVGNTLVLRVSVSDPVYYSIHSAGIEVNVGI